jgi:hypothetical protein
MKKNIIGLTVICLSLAFIPVKAKTPENAPQGKTVIALSEKEEIGRLFLRLDEIKQLTEHQLDPIEKNNLRKEVRSIKKRIDKMSGGGVYISVGGIIIILLLLIILF